jgi:potassium/hydrogen antiporter
VGVVLGAVATWVFARIPESIGAFAPVASVAAAALSFGVADAIGGSGFLSVYLVGLAVGSTPSRYRHQLAAFHEGIAFVAQVVLFVLLGLLVFPHRLPGVALSGLALALLLVLVARPAAVWISTAFSSFTNRERLLIGWAGLRGAVPIVLATFVLTSGVRQSDTIFNAVFFVVIVSTLMQGTTLEWLAQRLGLTSPVSLVPGGDVDAGAQELVVAEFRVAGNHAINGSALRELGLPRDALVAAIKREGDAITPTESTVIQAGDHLSVVAPRHRQPDIEDVFERWRRLI